MKYLAVDGRQLPGLPQRIFLIPIFIYSGFFLGIHTIKPDSLQSSSASRIYVHDSSFRPDRVLRVTAQIYDLDCTTRYSVVINGTVPGPELRFREGDKVWIRVYNDMPHDNLTIHWHGLTQRMSPFSDGTPAVSQWPIPPLHYFDYEFELEPGDAGTYFYHSHVGFAAVTAFGALIVDEQPGCNPPLDYQGERTLVLSDVFYNNDTYIVNGLMAIGGPFRWSGSPQNIALNGHSKSASATTHQKGPSCSYEVIRVSPGQVYRFRFIGALAFSQIFLAIEGHSSLTLFEVDGSYISPVDAGHLEISPGQRYSVLFQAKTQEELEDDRKKGKTQYWIQMETRGDIVVTTAFAVLAYKDIRKKPDDFTAPSALPLVSPGETFVAGWLEKELTQLPSRPYDDTCPLQHEITRRIIVPFQHVIGAHGNPLFHQHGEPWFETTPPAPYLVSLYKDDRQYFPDYNEALKNGGFDAKTKTFPAKIGEVLEIVWQGLVGQTGVVQTHPFHVHGDHVYDIGSGIGEFNATAAEEMLLRNMKNGGPIKRDTTNIYRTPPPVTQKPGDAVSWRAWRVRVHSAGVWMIHCHILPHMMMGMQTVFVFGEREDLKRLTPAQAALYLDYRGAAYGNASYSPRVLHYWHN